MSRRIDLTKELTEDERNYLLDRGWQHKLDENALHLMGGGADEDEIEPESKDQSEGDDTKKTAESTPAGGAIEPPPAVDEKTSAANPQNGDPESK